MKARLGMSFLAAAALSAAASAQTVEYRIVERTGQTQVLSGGDVILDCAVQARVVGGPQGSSLATGGFDVVLTGEADANGQLAFGLISNSDHTYASGFTTNSVVGMGGLASQYAFLANISHSFNGVINTSGGSFTNSPADQEIALVTASLAGTSLLNTPGLDPAGEGNVGTWSGYGVGATPSNGATATVDTAVGTSYLGTGGSWVDLYRFRYTVTAFTPRRINATLRNSAATTFTQFVFNSGIWATTGGGTVTPTVTGLTIIVGRTGACCAAASGLCSSGPEADCTTGTFIDSGVCSPTPCMAPMGQCCAAGGGGCTTTTSGACTGGNTFTLTCCNLTSAACATRTQATCNSGEGWNVAAACSPTPCTIAQGSCCNSSTGACSTTTQSTCAGPSVWTGGGSCSACTALMGACCDPSVSGGCVSSTQPSCPTGRTWVASTACSSSPCPTVGSCCNFYVGTCTLQSVSACGASAHVWTSGGTCTPNTCAQPGTCCNREDGACIRVSQAACIGAKEWSIGGVCLPNPCELPLGACCNVNGLCIWALLWQCRLPNQWTGHITCTPNPCPQLGRCCSFVSGACWMLLQSDCGTSSHTWTSGGSCSPNPCQAPGACCNSQTGACVRRTAGACTSGSTWMQSGGCSPNPCPQPIGVCCNIFTGGCTLVQPPACGVSAHTWTPGSSCSPNLCGQPGNCCNLGVCKFVTFQRCNDTGGFWLAGSCSPNPCVILFAAVAAPCAADFDRSRSVDSADILAFVNAWMSQDPRADYDHSDSIDVQDIFAYLTVWFAGCP